MRMNFGIETKTMKYVWRQCITIRGLGLNAKLQSDFMHEDEGKLSYGRILKLPTGLELFYHLFTFMRLAFSSSSNSVPLFPFSADGPPGFLSEFRTSPHRSRHRASRRLFGCDARCHRSMTNGAVTTARPPSQPDPSRWSLEGDIPAYHHAPPTLRVLRSAAFTYVVDQTNAAQPPPTSAANSLFNIWCLHSPRRRKKILCLLFSVVP